MVKARFDGQQDQCQDSFALVMFENDTWPIILGRELLGVPKLYADISPIKVLPDGRRRCEASLWGHMLFGIEVPPLTRQDSAAVDVANKDRVELPQLGYKYFSSPDGTPDAAHPVSTPSETTVEAMWLGSSGRFFVGNPGAEDIGLIAEAIAALRTLPVLQVIGVSRTRGSSLLRGDLRRRLR